MIKWITIVLALIGLAAGIYAVQTTRMTPPELPLVGRPSLNPFVHGIAASGKVEAATRNVAIAAPEPGIVAAVLVEVNQKIRPGDPLFSLDARLVDAERLQAEAALNQAQADLQRLESLPRPEDLLPLDAAVRRATIVRDDAREQWTRADNAFRQGAASVGEHQTIHYARLAAEAALAEVQAQRDRVAAGAWESDLLVARAHVARARAAIAALDVRRQYLTVRSPIEGVVLKRNIEPGEFAQPGPATPPLVIGDLEHLRVRAQVDEHDASRLRLGQPGLANLRSADRREFRLRMLRIEPLAVPKRELSGSIVETVDTRVVEVVFAVEPGGSAVLYPGQLVDVFIDAPPDSDPSPNQPSAPTATAPAETGQSSDSPRR